VGSGSVLDTVMIGQGIVRYRYYCASVKKVRGYNKLVAQIF
jgi:hypothetical protein